MHSKGIQYDYCYPSHFPDFFQQLKPELIAPVVTWLCHEDCQENGSIIESAIGWAGKCKQKNSYHLYLFY